MSGWVPINRLGSLRIDVMFPLSFPCMSLAMAANVHQDVSPKGMPQPEEIKLDSSKQRSNGLLTRGAISALLLLVQISLSGVNQKKIMRLGIKLKGSALAKGLHVHFLVCTQPLGCFSACKAVPCQ